MIKKQYSKTKAVAKVTFSLTTEQVGEGADVRVVGDFNDWSWDKGLSMSAKKNTYAATLELTAGAAYQFRYLVNGHHWFNDEAADDYLPTPFFSHNCLLVLEEVTIAAKPAAKKAAPKKAAPQKAAAKPAAAKKVEVKAAKTKKTAAKKAAASDDLKKIEGIGPKIADLLSLDGIKTYADLAKAKPADIKKVLAAAGSRYKMHDPTTWPQQAKLAAAGEWDKLATLQDKLKGGK
ncbi:MAG: DUF4332 domain-containing protein [Lewinella sp.]|nr:DUF4332 domain-containing protein [Lewinella sp.]